MLRLALPALLVAALVAVPGSGAAAAPPVELGDVAWIRDHDRAFERAASEEKPVLLLFQSVPGARAAKALGEGPLRMPLLVEAIETYFVPLVVMSNAADAAPVLARYKEPEWGDPVVRFFDADGEELIARRARALTALGVLTRMRSALREADVDVPTWVTLLEQDLVGSRLGRTTVAMQCFKDGERRIGGFPGVIRTEAAWIGEHEVVDVVFDPERIAFPALLEKVKHISCLHVYADDETQAETARGIVGDRVSVRDGEAKPADGGDRKFFLGRSDLRFLPLTPAQATKVNAALGAKQDPAPYLSPRQRALLASIRKAVEADEKALDGLTRPDDVAALRAYEARLRGRLP